MSYDLKRSHFSLILERKVTDALTVTEEGVVLVAVLDAATGTETVQLSAGSAGEVVAGFAIRDNADNSTTSVVEEASVPATGDLEIQLSNNNLVASTPGDGSTSSLRVAPAATPLSEYTIVDGASPSSGEVGNEPVTGLLTFNAAQAGVAVVITYRYNLTVAEARQTFYQRNINNEAGALFGQVGVGQGHGEIFTDQFDATAEWGASNQIVHTGANGLLAITGGQLIDARVISVPNVNNPLLGIAFSIGGGHE